MIEVTSFFDDDTSTLTHVVFDSESRDAVVIDPVMDFDLPTFTIRDRSVQKVSDFCRSKNLKVHFLLETHAHADHLSGSQLLKKVYPQARVAIGREISQVQTHFSEFFNLGKTFPKDGRQFDLLFADGDILSAGNLSLQTWHTPGHTPACYTLQIGEHLFVGDALFAPDCGTGRCDFPGGSAKTLFESIQKKIYSLSDAFTLHFGHDYPSERPVCTQVTLAESKQNNIRIKSQTQLQEFVSKREARDKELTPPRLFLPSLRVNIEAGKLPEPSQNGRSYLCLPIFPVIPLGEGSQS